MSAGRLLVLIAAAALLPAPAAHAQRYSDDEIRNMIIRDSIAQFGSKDCPCPYSYAWNGQQCADKSLYNQRTRRQDLYCYPNDIPWRDVQEYRRYHELRR
ncbi:MAG: hypothetical protein JSR47_22085 [Proteobacteria bacterium]|nr:hypothetical protein [Pseudomonadota bacterium]